MKCISCGSYFKRSPWNTGSMCENCEDTLLLPDDSEDEKAELNLLMNPSGKTQPVFYDDRDYDSHGF